KIARLELMRVTGERPEIADAKVACARLKGIAEGDRAERRIAARAAAGDGQPLAIHQPLRRQIARAIDTVIQVYHAPLALQAVAIGAAIAGAAAIVHIEDGEATARPVENTGVDDPHDLRGGAARAHDTWRRQVACGRHILKMARAVEDTVGRQTVLRRELDLLRNR